MELGDAGMVIVIVTKTMTRAIAGADH